MHVSQLATTVCSSTAVLLALMIGSNPRVLLLAVASLDAVCTHNPLMPRFHSRTLNSFHFATATAHFPTQLVYFPTRIADAGAVVAVLTVCFLVFGWWWRSVPGSSMFAWLVLLSLAAMWLELPPTPAQYPYNT